MKRPLVVALAILILGGLAMATAIAAGVGPMAQDPCSSAASQYGGDVAGSYSTTLGSIRHLSSLGIEADPWVGEPDTSSAVLCYINGQFAKGAPTTASGNASRSSNRAVIVILSGHPYLVAVGNASDIPIVAP